MSYEEAKKITEFQKQSSGPCKCDCGCTKFNDMTRNAGFFVSAEQCKDCDDGIHWDEKRCTYVDYDTGEECA